MSFCQKNEPYFQYLPAPAELQLSEHEFQFENGVLNQLQNQLHYTYSFFPDDDRKKEVPMGMYQRPTYHWDLECENGGDHTVEAALTEFRLMLDQEQPYVEMRESYGSWAVAATFIYTFTFCVPPAGMIIGTLLMLKPSRLTIELNDLLKTQKIYELPSWINECSRGDQQVFDGDKQLDYATVDPEFGKLVFCLKFAQIFSIAVVCSAVAWFLLIGICHIS